MSQNQITQKVLMKKGRRRISPHMACHGPLSKSCSNLPKILNIEKLWVHKNIPNKRPTTSYARWSVNFPLGDTIR